MDRSSQSLYRRLDGCEGEGPDPEGPKGVDTKNGSLPFLDRRSPDLRVDTLQGEILRDMSLSGTTSVFRPLSGSTTTVPTEML